MIQYETDACRLLVSERVDDLRRDYARSLPSPPRGRGVGEARQHGETPAPHAAALRRLMVRVTARGS